MVTTERINALLTVDRGVIIDNKINYPQEQTIFPGIRFTCSGQVAKWIIGATYSNDGDHYPELQIWRPNGNARFQKLNGTFAVAAEKTKGLYEFIVDPPLPFQPNDVLGVFQPSKRNSRLLIDYDSRGGLLNFYLPLDRNQVEPSHTFVDARSDGWDIGSAVPYVALEIGEF